MVVLKDTDCYLWTITSDERSKIHTDAGLRGVEVSRAWFPFSLKAPKTKIIEIANSTDPDEGGSS